MREIGSDVASIDTEKQELWTYELPSAAPGKRVHHIAVGVDGTCALFSEGTWRQVMVGTIAFFDSEGDRIDTIYVANALENGKATFFEKMERELERVREHYPDVKYVGIADGAHDQWEWLEKHTTWRILDFWHASEYLNLVSAAFGSSPAKQQSWFEETCHRLKHDKDAALSILDELKQMRDAGRLTKALREQLEKTITYFENQCHRMDYRIYRAMGFSIGSGVTEAACKCIAKERLCGTGMRWSLSGADAVLSLRTLIKSSGRWESFWRKTAQHGFSKITRRKRPTADHN